MNKREKNRLRDRASKRLIDEGHFDEAKAAWSRAWNDRHPLVTRNDVERARLAMLTAIDEGKTIAEAEQIAARELAYNEELV